MILKGQLLADKAILQLKNSNVPLKRLVIISLSTDPTSSIYISKKANLARELGVDFEICKLNESISKDELADKIASLNNYDTVGGVMIQMPIPSHFDRFEICSQIAKEKDIDGFGYITGKSGLTLPPTIMAIDALLGFYGYSKEGKKVLIVGNGFLVGAPLYEFYKQAGLDVEVLEEDSENYFDKIKSAHIVILATGGRAKFDRTHFGADSVVIDASTVASDNKLTGDLDLSNIGEDVSYSPVPGGVGPVTVAMLFVNFYLLCGSSVEGFGLINSH